METTLTLDDAPTFMIIPRAVKGMWEHYYGRDPSITPMPPKASVFHKLLGKVLDIKLEYNSREDAEKDLKRLLEQDPHGGYGIALMNCSTTEKPYLHYENKLAQTA